MWEAIVSILLGILCIILGVINRRGNLSTLHSYHYHRVTPEDRLPYGKAIGLGTILMGIGFFLMGLFTALNLLTGIAVFTTLSTVFLIVFLVMGFGFVLYAQIRYNHGFF